MHMTVARAGLMLPLLLLVGSCRRGEAGFPETPLGHVGHDWLAAHNRGEGHAVVHFTMLNRGSAGMNGAQMDSAVRAGVQFAQRVGPLVPVRLLVSSDSMLVVLLRSADDSLWSARFTPAAQPGLTKVNVEVARALGGKLVAYPVPENPRR